MQYAGKNIRKITGRTSSTGILITRISVHRAVNFAPFIKKLNIAMDISSLKISLFKKIEETLALGGKQILMQGGLHPSLKLDFYTDLLESIKSKYDVHLHSFSPPEIVHFSKLNGITVRDVIQKLREAGLDSIPGGGAEILSDRCRNILSPNKCTAQEWLDVMREAHKLGMRTTATMMFGHIETVEERIEHLEKIRKLQDETGGFTAFIAWTFQPKNTRLDTALIGSFDYLKTIAISRLYLDNIANIQASWVTQGSKIAQLSLKFGANDMGSTMIEENVVRAAELVTRWTKRKLNYLSMTLDTRQGNGICIIRYFKTTNI